VFIYEISISAQTELLIAQYGVVPNNIHRMVQLHVFNPLIIITLCTSLFLHGEWLHLGGNMLYLWIIGDNVEDQTGHVRFLLFYVFCGLVACMLQLFINPNTIGASVAISGVIGASLLMFPRARVVTDTYFHFYSNSGALCRSYSGILVCSSIFKWHDFTWK